MRVNGADSIWAEAREAQEQTIPSGVQGLLCRQPNYLHIFGVIRSGTSEELKSLFFVHLFWFCF